MKYVKLAQIAAEQGVDERTVRRWLVLGHIPGSNLTGRWKVQDVDYVAFKERQARGEARSRQAA